MDIFTRDVESVNRISDIQMHTRRGLKCSKGMTERWPPQPNLVLTQELTDRAMLTSYTKK